jgi:hypothetical protein
MRLGKEQAAGYVEDTEAPEMGENFNSDMERTPVPQDPQPAVAAG